MQHAWVLGSLGHEGMDVNGIEGERWWNGASLMGLGMDKVGDRENGLVGVWVKGAWGYSEGIESIILGDVG